MKRIAVLLAILLLLTSCSSEDSSTTNPQEATNPTEEETEEESSEIVLHEGEDYTAIYQGVWESEYVSGCFYLDIYFTNNTDNAVTFYIDDCYVNDEAVPLVGSGMPVEIAAGKKGKGSYIIFYQSLSISSVEEIEKIEGVLKDLDGKISEQSFTIEL